MTEEQGGTRYVVKSTFGMGRDFAVLDADGHQVASVDGQIGPRPKATVQDASGATVYTVTGRVFGFPKHMVIESPTGAEVASIKAKAFSPVKSRMSVHLANGHDWQLEGSFLEKEYTITADGRPVATITQKWVTIRDAYTLDVAEGADVWLALAVLWAVDRWVEKD